MPTPHRPPTFTPVRANGEWVAAIREESAMDDRWDKLKAGLYDAIYGKGLDQPYLDATVRLMDALKAEHTELLRAIHRLPKPPPGIGDGPDERIGYVLALLDGREQVIESLLLDTDVIPGDERPIRADCSEARDPGPTQNPNTEERGQVGGPHSAETLPRPGRVSGEDPVA